MREGSECNLLLQHGIVAEPITETRHSSTSHSQQQGLLNLPLLAGITDTQQNLVTTHSDEIHTAHNSHKTNNRESGESTVCLNSVPNHHHHHYGEFERQRMGTTAAGAAQPPVDSADEHQHHHHHSTGVVNTVTIGTDHQPNIDTLLVETVQETTSGDAADSVVLVDAQSAELDHHQRLLRGSQHHHQQDLSSTQNEEDEVGDGVLTIPVSSLLSRGISCKTKSCHRNSHQSIAQPY